MYGRERILLLIAGQVVSFDAIIEIAADLMGIKRESWH